MLEEYGDFLECHIEAWTVTTEGALVPGVQRHYIRILPEDVGNANPLEDPNSKVLQIKNHPDGSQDSFPARDIVDAGFLHLVRYGIRRPDDPVIVDSLKVIDAVLRVETPFGPCWHRYNHDGYGQRNDGSGYDRWGTGRVWPLLTGERGHYELAAGRSAAPFLHAMEAFASSTGLLPEQVWDTYDLPEAHMYLGKPTGAAMPLMWAHAEYIKLLRSASDGQVFDLIPEVAERYQHPRRRAGLEIWKVNRQLGSISSGIVLRIQTPAPFLLHWSRDQWQHSSDTRSEATSIGINFVDIEIPAGARGDISFTFQWL